MHDRENYIFTPISWPPPSLHGGAWQTADTLIPGLFGARPCWFTDLKALSKRKRFIQRLKPTSAKFLEVQMSNMPGRLVSGWALCVLSACGGGGGGDTAGDGAGMPGTAGVVSNVPATAPVSPLGIETGSTRIVYFLPQDETLRLEYEQAIAQAALTAQSWYAGQLGGRSFRLAAPAVEICRGDQPAAWYSSQSWSRVHAAVAACNPGFKYDDPAHRWIVYAQVRHQCGAPQALGATLRGVAIVPVQDLQGLAGERDIVDDCGAPVPYKGPGGINRWIGGLAHELGHALGLPHPPGCEAGTAECEHGALMWGGYAAFPGSALRPEERRLLLDSPFIFDLAAAR